MKSSPIVYLHGFNSSPKSIKATQTLAFLTERGEADRFYCPALPYSPAAAAKMIEDTVSQFNDDPFTLIGSSLGGFYATWAAAQFNTRAILVNPAVRPWTHPALLGPQRNMYSGETYILTEDHLNELKMLTPAGIETERYWLMVETKDETLDYRHAVDFYAGCRQTVIEGGDHSFQAWTRLLPEVVKWASEC